MDATDAIPVSWKRNILDDKGNSTNFCIFDCHFMKKIHINVINRSNKELFAMQQYCGNSKPASQVYFESLFETTLDWKEICLMLGKVTVDTFTRMFQFKIIKNFYT